MKGAKLTVAILTPLALFIGIIMAVFAWNSSWSQNHASEYDHFLYATLFFISMVFCIASYNHPDHKREVTKIKKYSIRLEHLMRLTAFLFGGVLVFGVNSPIGYVSTLHLFFTGFAIASGYIMVMTYPESQRGHTYALIGLVFGVGGFIGGFVGVYSIAWGEVLAAIPFLLWFLITWILKKWVDKVEEERLQTFGTVPPGNPPPKDDPDN